MKRVLSLVLATVMILSLCTFCATAEGTSSSSFVSSGTVKLPNLSKETVSKDGFKAWEGNVSFDTSSKAITFVFRIKGAAEQIVATKVAPTLVLADGTEWTWGVSSGDKWQWDNIWKNIFAPEMVIEKDGVYYLYLNQKVLVNNGSIAIQGVKSLNIFSTKGNNKKDAAKNNNDNATFEMLNIVQNDLSTEARFYNGDTLLTTQTTKYTSVGNNSAGDNLTGITDGVNNSKAKQFGAVKTPDEFFAQQTDVPLPTKESDEQYAYVFDCWVDANGNPVDAVYRDMDLYATFKPVANTHAVVTFLDVSGNVLQTGAVEKGTHPSCPDPVKTADDNYNYFFAGWTIDGETTVDLGTYEVSEDVTFSPVFKEDLILKATAELSSDILMSSTANAVKFKLNRTNVTVDAVNGIYEPITSGTVTFTYSDLAFAAVDGKTTVEVPFTSVDANGYVDAVFNLDTVEGVAGTFSHTVTCAVTTASEIVTTTSTSI